MMVVFTIFFGRMAGVPSGGLPYPLFAYAGLLPWTFFATAIAAAGNSVVGSERLITKIYFPRLAVPFAAVGAAVVDFLIAFGLLIAMMVYYRVAPGWGLLLVPAIFGAILLAALGSRDVAGGPERRLSRLPLRDPVPGPALDVRHAVGLHAGCRQPAPEASRPAFARAGPAGTPLPGAVAAGKRPREPDVAGRAGPQSDDRADRCLPGRGAGRADPLGKARALSAVRRRVRRRLPLFPAS